MEVTIGIMKLEGAVLEDTELSEDSENIEVTHHISFKSESDALSNDTSAFGT